MRPGLLRERNFRLLWIGETISQVGNAMAVVGANLALTGYTALLVVFLVRVVGLAPGWVGLLTAVPGLGGVLGAMATRRFTIRYGTARGLVLATWLGLPAALLIPLTTKGAGLIPYVVGSLAAYTGMGIGNIIIAAFRQEHSPPGMCGRVTATMRFFIFATSPAGALLGGSLGTWLGLRPALWIMLSLAVASGFLLCTRALLAQRNLPGQAQPNRSEFARRKFVTNPN